MVKDRFTKNLINGLDIIYRKTKHISDQSENDINKKIGPLHIRLALYFLNRIGIIGVLFIYITYSFLKNKLLVNSWCENIIYFDHDSKKIEKMLSKIKLDDTPSDAFRKKYLKVPRYAFISKQRISTIFEAYKQKKPSNVQELTLFIKTIYFIMWYDNFFSREMNNHSVIIIDDLHPLNLGVGNSAEKNNVRIALFVMTHRTGRIKPPFKVDIAFCWNRKQAVEYKPFTNHIAYMKRSRKKMKLISGNNLKTSNVGLILNAFFNENSVLDFCRNICNSLGIMSIKVRLHPRTVNESKLDRSPVITIAKQSDSFSDFCENLDFVFAGSTTAIIDVLFEGTPVVYVPNIDSKPMNFKSYIEDGLVYSSSQKNIDIKEVSEFYFSKNWKKSFRDLYNPPETCLTVREGLRRLNTRSI